MADGGGKLFESVLARAESCWVTHGPLPAAMADVLPNRRFRLQEGSRSTEFGFSTAVVVGQVGGVDKGPAFIHVGDDLLQPVAFDDPAAVERAIDVRVRAELFVAAEGLVRPPSNEVSFRWGGLGGLDRRARDDYMASAQDLGRVVAVLNTRKDRDGLVYIPILMGALLGQVRDDGVLRFPGLGDREKTFLGEIPTLAALTHAAQATPIVSPWTGPVIN